MNSRIYCLVIVTVALAALIGCVSTGPATPAAGQVQPAGVVADKGKTGMPDWDKTVAEARKEGYLTLYRSSYGYDRAAARFRQKYGITVEQLVLNGGQIAERMSREYRAGLYNVDLISTGYGGVRLLKPLGLLAPLDEVMVLPEVLDSSKWVGGKFPLVEHYQVDFVGAVGSLIWRNTELVGPNEIKEYRDILNPKWKGKIIFDDPQNSGAGTQWFRLYHSTLGEDYMRRLMQQEPLVMRDKRLEAEWLARGKYALLLGGSAGNLLDFRKAGAPIQPVETKEGDWIGPSSGIIQMAPRPAHPNAARLFINWLLTVEGQTLMSEENMVPSLRVDVPTGHLDADVVPKPGKVYVADTPETIAKANEYMEMSARIFAPILK
ncbi:MAG: extracellular solute-binding protein [Chloroflexi bacterium]|nr:extracellular solute-binding protein [Chloroflexota bacterium]